MKRKRERDIKNLHTNREAVADVVWRGRKAQAGRLDTVMTKCRKQRQPLYNIIEACKANMLTKLHVQDTTHAHTRTCLLLLTYLSLQYACNYCVRSMSCLPFVWPFLFTDTHTHTYTHARTHTLQLIWNDWHSWRSFRCIRQSASFSFLLLFFALCTGPRTNHHPWSLLLSSRSRSPNR